MCRYVQGRRRAAKRAYLSFDEWNVWYRAFEDQDLEEVYKVGIRWSFLKPLLINMLDVPEHLKPPEE